jgi:hypothetical protein
MSLLVESQARARAQRAITNFTNTATILNEHMEKQAAVTAHDIFLSHAYDDRELILGVTLSIEDLGYSVYVDWRDDPTLDRKRVTPQTAEKLRARMKASRCLFFSTTEHATESKWMPWELGYKDAHNTRAAILPIRQYSTQAFTGQEYLGIYPYVSQESDTAGRERLWVRRSPTCYVDLDSWLSGNEPWQRS